MIDEAAITVACKVVVAENKIHVAKVAVEELEKTTKLAEETDLLLELTKDIHEQCKKRDLRIIFLFIRKQAKIII
ncbi:unnamed protein product [Brassica rapa]|uniref:Uncharacterized protein n=2 Tax=Brassica TaxID=3705 RepID=A0A3P6ALR3_BRACM|nr:unnamed protein product [Brassica napus]CAG7893415.1 unnamed protein product [Brassica rapa]VDC88523.1 unnamed protein product [Brassica rapa]